MCYPKKGIQLSPIQFDQELLIIKIFTFHTLTSVNNLIGTSYRSDVSGDFVTLTIVLPFPPHAYSQPHTTTDTEVMNC